MNRAFLLISLIFFSFHGAIAQSPSPGPLPSPTSITPVVSGFLGWFQAHGTILLGVLFGLSEGLAAVPQIKANSVFQFVQNILHSLLPKVE